MDTIRVAIVDDNAVFRQVLRGLLEREQDLTVVGEAENGLVALDLVDETRPDVVLMDLQMPFMNGFDATSRIVSKYPETKIIVLSMHSDDGTRVRVEEVGASDFLEKGCHARAIVTSIRDVHLR